MEDVGGKARSGPTDMPDLVRGFMTVIAREAVKDLAQRLGIPVSCARIACEFRYFVSEKILVY